MGAEPATTRRLRADAARNRSRVLAAAADLFARHGAAAVTMEDIAAAAGVGKGTLYRRFRDRFAIAEALLDEHERALQERLICGPAPLGPGAPPADRLAAFYRAMVELLDRHVHLALAAETGRRRFGTGAYGFWRSHVRALVLDAGVDDPDALVDILLAPLAPELYEFQRYDRGLTAERVAEGLARLAHGVLREDARTSPQLRAGDDAIARTE